MSSVLLVFVIVLVGLVLVAAGVGIGYHLKEVYSELRAIRAKLASQEEGGGLPEIAIIEAKSPKQIKEEEFFDDEESAILTAKKPSELRREKDRRLNDELDKLGR